MEINRRKSFHAEHWDMLKTRARHITQRLDLILKCAFVTFKCARNRLELFFWRTFSVKERWSVGKQRVWKLEVKGLGENRKWLGGGGKWFRRWLRNTNSCLQYRTALPLSSSHWLGKYSEHRYLWRSQHRLVHQTLPCLSALGDCCRSMYMCTRCKTSDGGWSFVRWVGDKREPILCVLGVCSLEMFMSLGLVILLSSWSSRKVPTSSLWKAWAKRRRKTSF